MMMPRPRTIHDFYFPEANVPVEGWPFDLSMTCPASGCSSLLV